MDLMICLLNNLIEIVKINSKWLLIIFDLRGLSSHISTIAQGIDKEITTNIMELKLLIQIGSIIWSRYQVSCKELDYRYLEVGRIWKKFGMGKGNLG